MRVISKWKITFDPAGAAKILLNYGDMMDGEIEPALSKGIIETPLLRNPFPRLHAGKASVDLSFSVFASEISDIATRIKMMDGLQAFAILGIKPLRIEASGSNRYWQYEQAGVSAFEPSRIIEGEDPEGARRETRYTIRATSPTTGTTP